MEKNCAEPCGVQTWVLSFEWLEYVGVLAGARQADRQAEGQ